MPYNFNAMDGGERASGNQAYYNTLGIYSGEGEGRIVFGTPAAPAYAKSFMNLAASYNAGFWKPLGLSIATLFFGTRIFVGALNGDNQMQFLNANGNAQIYFLFNGDGSLSVYRGAALLEKSEPGLIALNAVIHLDTNLVVDPAAGQVVVWLNGNPSPIINVTGANTANDATSLPIIGFGGNRIGGGGLWWRDMYVHDGTGPAPFNAQLGNVGLELQMPASNVAAELVPTGGSNYQNAAQTPPNPTVDYNSSSTPGAYDTYGLTPLPTNVLSLLAVVAFEYSNKNDTGARATQKTIISGTGTSVGAENYLSETPVVNQDAWVLTDPGTGNLFAAGSPTASNAIQLKIAVAA